MIILAIASGVLYVTLLIELFRLQGSFDRREAQWGVERRELLERIQRPERVPTLPQTERIEVPEQPPDEWNLVGSISINDDYGLEDD